MYIASDHAGFELKKKLLEYFKFKDLGPYKYNKDDDYPDYASKLAKEVKKTNSKGILICGSGQGMCIAANKISGIRAALAWDKKSAKLAKEHLNANVLCLAGRVTQPKIAKEMIKEWLNTKFKHKKRHIRRINKIKKMER